MTAETSNTLAQGGLLMSFPLLPSPEDLLRGPSGRGRGGTLPEFCSGFAPNHL